MAQVVKYSHFVAGIDRSQGRYVEDPRLLFDADNVVFTNGRRIRSRPPVKRLDVELDGQTQGLAYVDCGLRVVARFGDDIEHTGDDADEIDTLFFDVPDYCGPEWELLHLLAFGNMVEAWIAHEFPGPGDMETIVFKHTLDPQRTSRRKPTYCEDPWCPTNWDADGERPLHLYGKGEIGEPATLDPVSVAAAEKLCAARTNGDVGFSAVGNSRVWNPFSLQDLLDFGRPYYFLLPVLPSEDLFGFVVSEYHSDLDNDRAWAGYILEYLDADGRWQKVTEVNNSPTEDKTYFAQAVQSRFETDRNETRIVLRWEDDQGLWLRWRAVAGLAPIQIIDGGDLQEGYVPDDWSEVGDDEKYQFTTDVDYADFKLHYSTILIKDGLELSLILGPGMHYTISDDDGKGRIDFCTDSGEVYQLPSGLTENSYVTNLRWDTQRYVGILAPTVWTDGDPTNVVPLADYTLTNADGYIRLTWDANVPTVGTEWTIGFLPTADDEARSDATATHYEGGSYLFEGVVWQFPAIKLSDMTAGADILAGIPHYPLLYGSGIAAGGGGGAVYTSAGSYSYTVPAGITSITVSTWAGGGGGGGWECSAEGVYAAAAAGGGGGGGEFHIEEIAVTPGEVLTIEVGAGGAAKPNRCWTISSSCNTGLPLPSQRRGDPGGNTRISRGATVLAEVAGGLGGDGGETRLDGLTVIHEGGDGGDGGDSGHQVGADGGKGSDFNVFLGTRPPAPGGVGGASGAGDTYGRGGNGGTAHYPFGTSCNCTLGPAQDGNDGRVLIEAEVGLRPWVVDPNVESMPLNGWERYHLALRHRFVVDGTGAIVGSKPYHYGAEEGAEASFYADRRAEYAKIAGKGDAGYVESSAREQACGNVTALSAMQDKLAVHYHQVTLLYQFGLDPERNAPIDALHFGARGKTTPFYSGTMMLTQQGFRMLNLRGENFDSLRDNNYGRAIESINITEVYNAAYWPALGAYIAIANVQGEVRIVMFAFSWEEKVRAWTLGTIRDFDVPPVVDSLWAADRRLYFRYDNLVRYFDHNATVYADDVDILAFEAAGGADAGEYLEDHKYVSRVIFQPNNLDDPGTIKRWTGLDVECQGRCHAWMRESERPGTKRIKGATYDGTSLARKVTPLMIRSYALSVELESVDVDGWELDSLFLRLKASRR